MGGTACSTRSRRSDGFRAFVGRGFAEGEAELRHTFLSLMHDAGLSLERNRPCMTSVKIDANPLNGYAHAQNRRDGADHGYKDQ